MRWKFLCVFSLLLASPTFGLPSNGPCQDSNDQFQAAFRVNGGQEESIIDWGAPPNPNSTHHFIFNTISGALKRWPNTLRRNGHSIIPATILTGTILYHGRSDHNVPDNPDWLAFDFEHASLFCQSSCFVISLQAKRDLRLLYFDGSSAAKMKDGPMDSQDVVAWGRPRPDKYFSEHERIEVLCDWGRQFGLDGFVRMEFHFEVMICNISDGLQVVSLLNLLPKNASTPRTRPPGDRPNGPQRPPPGPFPRPDPPPPGWRGSLLSDFVGFFEAQVAGGWHDHAPGETRVHLDYSGLVTFHDTRLSSLVNARWGKDRLHHRLEGISPADVERVLTELRSVLTRKRGEGSNVDWASIARVIMERYADRLEYLRFLLSPNTTFADTGEQASAAREQLLIMLSPYLTVGSVPPPEVPTSSVNASWAARVVQRCATTQTLGIRLGMLTAQEARLHAAIEHTLHEICRRLMLVWLEFFDIEGAAEAKAVEAISVGRGHISELMIWLDWSVWVRCEPGCGLGENCYLPSWPFLGGVDPYEMTPRCISPRDLALAR